MNAERSSQASSETKRLARNTIVTGTLTALVLVGITVHSVSENAVDRLWVNLPALFASLAAIWLSTRGRHFTGGIALLGAVAFQMTMTPLIESGVGLANAIGAIAAIGSIGLVTFARRLIGRILMAGLIVGMAVIFVDLFAPAARPAATFIELHWAFTFIVLAIFAVLFARELYTLDIRTKIVLGILATGGLSLGVLTFFAFERAGQIVQTLSGRLETSVRLLAEEQLINTVFTEASLANESFEDIVEEVVGLSHYWVSLQSEQPILRQGTYWDASTNLTRLTGGQYGNPATDVASVFVPANTRVDESLFADLNTSAYLDFRAPDILETHPSLLAVYAIDARGVTRYYPNINLASLLPPDFDATQRPFYVITSPLFNPERLPRWTIPDVDATGGGLEVTVAAPVYIGDEFSGVVAANMTMENITAQIGLLKIGQTGYSYMIDSAGRVISMPPAGFKLFGIQPEELNTDEYFKQTILGAGSDELQAITRRMVAGGRGLLIVKVNGIDTYVSFAPIKANGYSIALVVPVSELQGAIATAHQETQRQIFSAVQIAAIIFSALLLAAILVSLGIGSVIAAPIIRLTQTADRIVAGDLAAQADVRSRDEIGLLAEAFNTMTLRLRQILEGLEQRVADRTAELAAANEKNESRARQFESIAHIAGTISSTRDMDRLLPQITSAISNQFGFYHVGIFLLDPRGEYAVLSAANSEGGQRMLARNHKLKVGETGIVGFVTGTGKPRVALNTGEDAVFFNNPDLPETRSEIALPLRVGEDVIGALDVQSTVPNAFDQEDINILTTLADQVGIAIQNARQYEETRKALAESEALSRQFIQSAWRQFTESQNLIGVHHTGARATLLYRDSADTEKGNNVGWNQPRTDSDSATLSVPIKLREEVIGSVDIRAPGGRKWEQDELDIVAAIIERAALAMENARLLQESQRRAAKEQKVAEVMAKIGASINIRNVLQSAVEELGRAIPGSEVLIQLDTKERKQ